jgi:uncharacterized membrane protein
VQAPEDKKEINMWKFALALVGFIIFVVLFGLFSTTGDLALILLPAFAAIFIIVIAIGIAPWLHDRSL